MELTGKKIGILVEDQHEDIELWYPLLRLREAGADVSVIGLEKGKVYHGKRGYPIKADQSVDETDPASLDALVIPGGYAPDRMRVHDNLIELVKQVNDNGGIIAIICHAGWVAISAGILNGKHATAVRPIRDDMINAGVQWVDEEVVVDGNLISSRTPWDLPAYCRALIAELRK